MKLGPSVSVSATHKWAAGIGARKQAGLPIISLGLGEPGYHMPKFIIAAALARRVSASLGHLGIMDADGFMTPEEPVILELNPRFGGGYPFSHEAGANVPAALIAWAAGRPANPEWLRVRYGVFGAKCDRLVTRSEATV